MKINKEKLNKQIETMNKEQLIDLCKSTTNIIDDLQDRIDKAIEYIKINGEVIDIYEPEIIINKCKLLSILRGEDNDKS